MSDFQLDVTKPSGETVTITTPDATYTYEVVPLTREPMLLFDKLRRRDLEDEDLDAHATALIEGVGALLASHNGNPAAAVVLSELWQQGYLGLVHLRSLSEHLLEKASGGRPPA